VSTLERVQSALAGLKSEVVPARDETTCLAIEANDAHEACRRLRDVAGFETNTFVTAIDRFPSEPRFHVYWQFLSIAHDDRVRLVARLRSTDPRVPTIIDLYPGAAFSERECYDMFGVWFDGHPGLKRLMMPEEYPYFPLRKDFPHQGIEPDRLYREWDARRHERAAEERAIIEEVER
jgi:NADH-quinone oxidoreductase subunit C